MPPKPPHCIRRQYLDVEMQGSESDAFALQGKLAALLRQRLMPVIEQALDRYSPAQGILRIERLDIDLGSIALERLEQDLPQVLGQCVELALDARLSRYGGSQPVSQDGPVQVIDSVQALDEGLAWFLRYGTLPCTLYLASGMNLESTLVAAWRAAGSTSSLALAPLLLQALAGQAALERLARRFTARFHQALLSRLSSPAAAALGLGRQRLHAGVFPADRIRAERLLCQAAFTRVLQARTCTAEDLVEDAMHLDKGASATRTGTEGQYGASEIPVEGVVTGATAEDHLSHADEEEGIFINNAGLVLLHPFLSRLFEALKLSEGESLLQPGRALVLLHLLASGQVQAPEYELALPKLLCGLPLTANVDIDLVLGAEEIDEAQGLLEAVIGHWTALRNTSSDGLRGTFLMRPGKLARRNGEWLLQVEQQTVDILMSELPWGVSAVRLPWMEQILWVEWA
ncbi:contractile injection system tape measure protein [Pseudomonas sp. NPDC090755]|uniref:contractile injection system tape measure protein n=1 Tax=Pseudomonas sp. NPDC090755 TaxID=3364481 RepID=UPI00383A29D1